MENGRRYLIFFRTKKVRTYVLAILSPSLENKSIKPDGFTKKKARQTKGKH
jgi:hypothetical protein